jgi:hypothetical protein
MPTPPYFNARERALISQRGVRRGAAFCRGRGGITRAHLGLHNPAAGLAVTSLGRRWQEPTLTSSAMATRIAAMAQGGEILCSLGVRELCGGKGFLFADRAEQAMHGFEDPIPSPCSRSDGGVEANGRAASQTLRVLVMAPE